MIKTKYLFYFTILLLSFGIFGCQKSHLTNIDAPTKSTLAVNASFNQFPLNDEQSFKDASRGFIAPLPKEAIMMLDNPKITAYDSNFSFINKAKSVPNTVNPSLWRQAKLLNYSGLFEVTDHVYQVRGMGIADITFVEGQKGITVIDSLTGIELSKAALDLYFQHRPKRPIVAIIITHSHADHFGGIKGIIDEAQNPNLRIITPQNFEEESISENVILGNAMVRRAYYMYGSFLPRNAYGSVNIGLGQGISNSTNSFARSTDVIKSDGQTLIIDGITYQFIMAQHTEAPSEFMFYIKNYGVFDSAELAVMSMHNLYSIRGAKTRDSIAWYTSLDKAIDFVQKNNVEAMIPVHTWPIWGKDRIIDHLKKTRDLYKFTHDQAIRLANEGYNLDDIANMVHLPKALENYMPLHGYYGSLKTNLRAVYNLYLGFYDGNPANLDPLPRVDEAKKFIEYAGGKSRVLTMAKQDFDKGDYRFAAKALNYIVFADPNDKRAKALLARIYVQLAYQQENGTWRAAYLSGAMELRGQLPDIIKKEAGSLKGSPDVMAAMTMTNLLDFLSVLINADKADGHNITMNLIDTKDKKTYGVTLENAVLLYNETPIKNADVTITGNSLPIAGLLAGRIKLSEASLVGLKVTGNTKKLLELPTLMDQFGWFNIVTQ